MMTIRGAMVALALVGCGCGGGEDIDASEETITFKGRIEASVADEYGDRGLRPQLTWISNDAGIGETRVTVNLDEVSVDVEENRYRIVTDFLPKAQPEWSLRSEEPLIWRAYVSLYYVTTEPISGDAVRSHVATSQSTVFVQTSRDRDTDEPTITLSVQTASCSENSGMSGTPFSWETTEVQALPTQVTVDLAAHDPMASPRRLDPTYCLPEM